MEQRSTRIAEQLHEFERKRWCYSRSQSDNHSNRRYGLDVIYRCSGEHTSPINVKQRDMTTAPPPPISCHRPDSHTMRIGKICGNKPRALLEIIQVTKSKQLIKPTHCCHPSITEETSDQSKHQDLLASNAISQGSEWN